VARYEYTDERGKVLYTVRRHEPKGFTVRSTTGAALNQLGRYSPVAYRLVELLAADPSATVFVVEGEKDVDRLRAEGLVATCNAFGGGQGKWKRGHGRYLRGRDVVILPDNDRTGMEHGRAVAYALRRTAASVRLVDLPGLPHKGDVSDWLDAGHTVAELRVLAEATRRWKPGTDPLPEPDLYEVWKNDFDRLKDARRQRKEIYGLPVLPTEKLLLTMLSEFARPRQEELAMYLGVTPRRVRQMISRLETAGILSVGRRGRQNSYGITTRR
jgi:hypothetical protein